VREEEPRSRFGSLVFVLGRIGMTVLLGGLLAKYASQLSGFDWRWIVGPMAGFVAAVGPGWFIDQVKMLWHRKSGGSVP
jgi:hypothetical protein